MSPIKPYTRSATLAMLVVVVLAGCGFHLRGSSVSGEGNNSFAQRLYLEGPGAHTGFASVFVTALVAAGGKQVFETAESTAVVHIYQATFKRQSITLSNTGRATGFDLSYRISYDVRSPKNVVIEPRKEFEVKRDYYNDQTLPLAQQAEEGQINEALANEAAQSLLRRVVSDINKASEPVPEPAKAPEKNP
jgi:LPS-assembly lipoprotein